MRYTISNDGTKIAYDQMGSGPAVILVGGGSTDRTSSSPLADLLSQDFTVFNYDRRGRGDSGDQPEYAIGREIEDIAAIISAAGGSANLFGTSSGAALALEAAASGLQVTRLALWEPPYILAGTRPALPANQPEIYRGLVAAGKRGDAVEFFMTRIVGLPEEFAAQARQAPWWAATEALAHTLAYDATIMGDYSIPNGRLDQVAVPVLVLVGGASWDWLQASTKALAERLPDGRLQTLPEQTHDVAPSVLAPALAEFFKNGSSG